jgi:alkanesulfonate monooxygenase SsuD/methylene tetrahydromethanopterin reductase-like flavin-dependent oxidoreductase (luciferase family)
MFDHFTTVPVPTDEITFESCSSLAALAALTTRVRLGHIVLCTAFRNPALTAKILSTLDVISGGRMELGIGAGWKRDEWLAYGYGFPPTRERLAMLGDHLEIITRMLEGGPSDHATFEGRHAHVRGAINVPKPIQRPRIPIMVGGNGPDVTWRLAARHADELNVDGMSPDELARALPVIRSRCEEIGRDPDSLRISVHLWWGRVAEEGRGAPGTGRIEELARFRELGVHRVMELVPESATSDEVLERYAEDARAAGVVLAPA